MRFLPPGNASDATCSLTVFQIRVVICEDFVTIEVRGGLRFENCASVAAVEEYNHLQE
jgi:hypothetical protein